MIHLEIDNKPYKCIEKWDEMKLSTATLIHTLCKTELPEKLVEYYQLLTLEDNKEDIKKLSETYTEKDIVKHFPEFYGKAIELLTDIPKEIIDKLQSGYRQSFYKKYCEMFVFGILHFPVDYKIEKIKSFNFNDTEYFLPETKIVLNQHKPFFDRSAIEFTEAADLEMYAKELSGGKYEMAANIISILCRPKIVAQSYGKTKVDLIGLIEPYDEQTCLNRAEQFEDLTMDKVFEVFFCFQQHTNLSEQLIQLYTQEEVLRSLHPSGEVI